MDKVSRKLQVENPQKVKGLIHAIARSIKVRKSFRKKDIGHMALSRWGHEGTQTASETLEPGGQAVRLFARGADFSFNSR